MNRGQVVILSLLAVSTLIFYSPISSVKAATTGAWQCDNTGRSCSLNNNYPQATPCLLTVGGDNNTKIGGFLGNGFAKTTRGAFCNGVGYASSYALALSGVQSDVSAYSWISFTDTISIPNLGQTTTNLHLASNYALNGYSATGGIGTILASFGSISTKFSLAGPGASQGNLPAPGSPWVSICNADFSGQLQKIPPPIGTCLNQLWGLWKAGQVTALNGNQTQYQFDAPVTAGATYTFTFLVMTNATANANGATDSWGGGCLNMVYTPLPARPHQTVNVGCNSDPWGKAPAQTNCPSGILSPCYYARWWNTLYSLNLIYTGTPDFSISQTACVCAIVANGKSGTATLTISAINGFAQSVVVSEHLAAQNGSKVTPPVSMCQQTTSGCTFVANGTGSVWVSPTSQATLQITVYGSPIRPVPYILEITGSSNGNVVVNHTWTISFFVLWYDFAVKNVVTSAVPPSVDTTLTGGSTANPGSIAIGYTTSGPNEILILFIYSANAGNPVSVVDGHSGVTWAIRASVNNETEYYAKAATTLGVGTVTISFGGSCNSYPYCQAILYSMKGVNFASPFDSDPSTPAKTTQVYDTTSSGVASLTVSTHASVTAVIAGCGSNWAGDCTPISGKSIASVNDPNHGPPPPGLVSVGAQYQTFFASQSNVAIKMCICSLVYTGVTWGMIVDALDGIVTVNATLVNLGNGSPIDYGIAPPVWGEALTLYLDGTPQPRVYLCGQDGGTGFFIYSNCPSGKILSYVWNIPAAPGAQNVTVTAIEVTGSVGNPAMLDGWTIAGCVGGYQPCSTLGSLALTTTKPNDLIVLFVYACAPVNVPGTQGVPPSCLSSGSPFTVTDSARLTWAQRPSSGIGYEYYANSASPITSDVITVSSNSLNNCSSPCAISMQIAAFSGTKQIFDPNVAFTETGCPQPQSQPCATSISATNTYDVLVGSTVFAGSNGGSAGPTACCSYISSSGSFGYGVLMDMYELTSSAGSNSMSFNWYGCTSSQYCNPTAFDTDAIEASTSLTPTYGTVFDLNPNDKVFDSDFRLLPPESGFWLSMTAGSTLRFPISLVAFPDFSGLVSVSGPNIQGPPGWKVCTPTCSASMNGNMSIPNASNVMLAPNQNKTITVTLTTTANAPLGNYTIGFGSLASFGPNHPLNVVVSVVDFKLSAPSSLGVSSGLSTNTQITTTDLASGPINVTLSGSVPALYQPTGSAQARPLGISFGQTSVFLTSGQTSDQMTVSALNVPAGVTYYPVTITGTVQTTSGTTISHSVVMNVTVSGFSMTADGVSCAAPTYILCLSVPQNGVPGDTVYLYASGITGTVAYGVSISPCVSLCNGGTSPSVFWNDTRSSQSSIGVTSSSCYQRSIYGTQNVGNYCGQRLLIIHAYDGLGNYNITVTGTCTGSCLNSQYTFYIWFNVFQSGGGGGSVAAGTLITLSDGSQVAAQNLREGMQVLSYDMSTHSYVTTTITRYFSVVTNNQMEIHTSTSKPLIVDQNPAQRLYVQTPDGTVRLMSVTQLQVGYKLFNALSEQWVPITSLNYQNGGSHVMYDIYTTAPGNYIANGILDPLKM